MRVIRRLAGFFRADDSGLRPNPQYTIKPYTFEPLEDRRMLNAPWNHVQLGLPQAGTENFGLYLDQIPEDDYTESFTVHIDWGDGSAIETFPNTLVLDTIYHTYPDDGHYAGDMIFIEPDETEHVIHFGAQVANEAPYATINGVFSEAHGRYVVSLVDPNDPSSADTTAGFRYSFAGSFDDLASSYSSANTGTMELFEWDEHGEFQAWGRIFDKDGGYRDYNTTLRFPDLAVVATSSSQMNLSWADTDPLAPKYRIQRSLDGQNFSIHATLNRSDLSIVDGVVSWNDTALEGGKRYWYRVRAVDDTGGGHETGYSPKKDSTTLPIVAPSGLIATANSSNRIALAWQDNSSNETRFLIAVSFDGTAFHVIDEVSANTTAYELPELPAGMELQARIIAAEDETESAPSTTVSARSPLLPPAELSATVSLANQIDLSWVDLSGGVASTTILVSTDGTTFTDLADVPAGTQSYSATGLLPNVHYTFKVVGDFDGDLSPSSAPLTATSISSNLTASTGATVAEGSNYTLTVGSSPIDTLSFPIAHWLVDWGDESAVETISGASGSSVAHSITSASAFLEITITAVDTQGNTFRLPNKAVNVIPTAPTNVVASPFSRNRIDLSWADNSEKESGHTILRSDDGGVTYVEVGYADADATTFSDSDVEVSAEYQYQVMSLNQSGGGSSGGGGGGGGSGSTSNPVIVPNGNVALTATSASGLVTLHWVYAGKDAPNFDLEWKEEGGLKNFAGSLRVHNSALDSATQEIETVTLPGFHPGLTYKFRVRAVRTDGTVSDYDETSVIVTSDFTAPVVSLDAAGDIVVQATGTSTSRWFLEAASMQISAPAFGPGWVDWSAFTVVGGVAVFSRAALPAWGDILVRADNAYIDTTNVIPTGQRTPYSQPFSVTSVAATLAAPSVQIGQFNPVTNTIRVMWTPPGNGVKTHVWVTDSPEESPTWNPFEYGWKDFEAYDGKLQGTLVAQNRDGTNRSICVKVQAGVARPDTPVGLVATPFTPKKVKIHWRNTPNDETQFILQRSRDSTFNTDVVTIATLGVDQTKFDDTVDGKFTYHYRVKAKNQGGDSSWAGASVDPGPIIVEFMGADTVFNPILTPGSSFNGGNILMHQIYQKISAADYQIQWFWSINIHGAFNWLLTELDTNGNGKYDPGQFPTGDQRRDIDIFGHSWGGTSAAQLSTQIFTNNKFVSKQVAKVFAIDPVNFGRLGDNSIWANVHAYRNYYQTNPKGAVNISGIVVRGNSVASDAVDTFQCDLYPFFPNINHVSIIDIVELSLYQFLLGRAL